MTPAEREAIKALVATWPLPTAAQRDRLAQLLRPSKRLNKAA